MCSESCGNLHVTTFDLLLSGRISARVSWPESEIFPSQVPENCEEFSLSSNLTTLDRFKEERMSDVRLIVAKAGSSFDGRGYCEK
jgi:hypothetical protein